MKTNYAEMMNVISKETEMPVLHQGNAIMYVADIIAMKALKTAYSDSGLSMYEPKKTNPTFDEFRAIALLALAEQGYTPCVYLIALLRLEECNDYRLLQIVSGTAYKAINAFIRSNRKDTRKTLYSDHTVEIGKNGDVEIVSAYDKENHNETRRLNGAKFELAQTLKRELSSSEWQVLKYMVLGYSKETICAKMGYSFHCDENDVPTYSSTIQKMKTTKQHARQILKRTMGIDVAISETTKTRRRNRNGKGGKTK